MEPGALRWAECGAMALTGDADGDPLVPPSDVVLVLDSLLALWGLDAGVVAERAALLGLRRQGRRSCGGATCLLRCADGWVAVALPRPDDVASVPAWLGIDWAERPAPGTEWDLVADLVAGRTRDELVEAASVLGIACSAPGEVRAGTPPPPPPVALPPLGGEPTDQARWVVAAQPQRSAAEAAMAATHPLGSMKERLVVDLSGLWAGPLCADLLRRAGATVVKVEDLNRPDGGRRRPAFYDLLNAGKASVAVDLSSGDGRAALGRLLRSADVIVTSARRRAFEQLELSPADVLGTSTRSPVWVAITGHGWDVDRVGFGDDCAVAGGLLAWHPDDGAPRFAADALADPVAGVFAAVRAMHAIEAGVPAFLDCSLAASAAAVRSVGPARRAPGCAVTAPRGREPLGLARPLGADTASVLGSLPA
jgi:hypothetical protein